MVGWELGLIITIGLAWKFGNLCVIIVVCLIKRLKCDCWLYEILYKWVPSISRNKHRILGFCLDAWMTESSGWDAAKRKVCVLCRIGKYLISLYLHKLSYVICLFNKIANYSKLKKIIIIIDSIFKLLTIFIKN